MPLRIAHLLLVLLLLLGQVGGWLHELSHHVAPVAPAQNVQQVAADFPDQSDDDDGDRDHCLLCLSFAALSLALLSTLAALALPSLRLARPAGARLLRSASRWLAYSARGPPRLS